MANTYGVGKTDVTEVDELVSWLRLLKSKHIYRELAEDLGVSLPTLVRWIHGKTGISPAYIKLLKQKRRDYDSDEGRIS